MDPETLCHTPPIFGIPTSRTTVKSDRLTNAP